MKITHATVLLPLILLAGCAFNGENQSRELDLKGLCLKVMISGRRNLEDSRE